MLVGGAGFFVGQVTLVVELYATGSVHDYHHYAVARTPGKWAAWIGLANAQAHGLVLVVD
ncbi:MAG TPA: hypothetical protein DEV93_06065 [Chloroflexi bacterium]|jgi:hypothetical protein|nr:hypothetical protein [Chloroflexota bacterium]